MSVLSECGSTFENFGYHWKHLRLQMKSTQLLVRTVHLNKILKWNALVSLFLNKIDEATRYGLNFEIQTLSFKLWNAPSQNGFMCFLDHWKLLSSRFLNSLSAFNSLKWFKMNFLKFILIGKSDRPRSRVRLEIGGFIFFGSNMRSPVFDLHLKGSPTSRSIGRWTGSDQLVLIG